MKYLLLIYGDENALSQPEREHCYAESMEVIDQIRERNQYVGAAPLQPTRTATSLRIRGGQRLVTDGPFAETHEQLGGFWLIDVRDLDEAIGIASKIPAARWGTVEIRPIVELPGLADR